MHDCVKDDIRERDLNKTWKLPGWHDFATRPNQPKRQGEHLRRLTANAEDTTHRNARRDVLNLQDLEDAME